METLLEKWKREELEERIDAFKKGKGLLLAIEAKTCKVIADEMRRVANELKEDDRTYLILWNTGLLVMTDSPYKEHFVPIENLQLS